MSLDTRNIADHYKELDLERIRFLNEAQTLPYGVCVENISGNLNMGVILRAANAFGARHFYYLGKKHWDRRSSVGVHNYTSVQYIDTDTLFTLKNEFTLVGVENNCPGSQPIKDFMYPAKPLFIFGEEGAGLSQEVLALCDQLVYIPQRGTVRSLNVSTAAGIILFDYVNSIC